MTTNDTITKMNINRPLLSKYMEAEDIADKTASFQRWKERMASGKILVKTTYPKTTII